MKPINIHSSNSSIYLLQKKYCIDILGGWHIKENGFTIGLINEETGESISLRRSKFRVQSFKFGKRAKRYFEVNVPKEGKYTIDFINPKKLQVKRTNLFITSMLMNPIPNEDIEVCFS